MTGYRAHRNRVLRASFTSLEIPEMFWVWWEVLLERHPACILLPPPFCLLSTLYVHQEWWTSRRCFWCYKGGLVIFCTITDGRRAEWGEWWSSLGQLVYFWDRTGLGNLLWLWNSSLSSRGDGRSLHSHPGCSVSLQLPTKCWQPVLSGFHVSGGRCWWILSEF